MTESLRPDELRALGAFFVGQPERILSVAAPLQHARRQLVSRVQGPSMGDSLPDGAEVLIELCQGTTCAPGDIVAFLLGARVTLHRLRRRAGRRRDILITAGDAHLLADPPVPADAVLGRVIGVGSADAWSPPPPLPRRSLFARCVGQASTVSLALLCLAGFRTADRVARALYRARTSPDHARTP